MLETIKLDDRTYEEIRDEAIANIVKHCPEWTNHNASDPGITLVELFSSMTEMMLYRLNQVPQKNYLAFLDLIGIKQRLPIPARTMVSIGLSEGYQIDQEKKSTILLKKGAVVTTQAQADEDAIIFETQKELYLSNAKLSNVYTKKYNAQRSRDEVIDHTQEVLEAKVFEPFQSDKDSINHVQVYLSSEEFGILQNNVKATLMFRLPTTMRTYRISKDFFKQMHWQFFDGYNWIDLSVVPNYNLVVDDKDADVLVVTFNGENASFEKGIVDVFGEEEVYAIRGIFTELPYWLSKLMVYEVSLVASSDQEGTLPAGCYHNYEQLDMNGDFYPFGSRPKVDNPLLDEVFSIRSDEAFSVSGSMVSLQLEHSLNGAYQMPQGSGNLQIVWEYPVGVSKWRSLEVQDETDNFMQSGNVIFKVPDDIAKISLNGEEGYWVRARILAGDFGEDEKSEYDEESGSVSVKASTLRPPLLHSCLVHYTLARKDLSECMVFNDFKFHQVSFDKNRPVPLFTSEYSHEEAIVLGFDSYLSDEKLDILFDIEEKVINDKNLYSKQRVLSWELLLNGKWVELEVDDATDGLTQSGSVRIYLPTIEALEPYTMYIKEYKRMWIKARVKFNALHGFPRMKTIKLNSVEASQQESFRNEYIAHSIGLPSMRFKLNDKNLIQAPIIQVGEEEFKAVERLIDYGSDDKVFMFNGMSGEIEFGNGKNGAIPELGSTITAKEYVCTIGSKGNLRKGNLTILRDAINYIDSVTNFVNSTGGKDGDGLEELKKHAPSILKTMKRAVTIEDYQRLAEGYSPFIKKAKCVYENAEVLVILLTEDILENKGFINKSLLKSVENKLRECSVIGVEPHVMMPRVRNVKLHLSLKYTIENYSFLEEVLREKLLKQAKQYFDPFIGYNTKGYPLGRSISKGDLHNIINAVDSTFYMHDVKFQVKESHDFLKRLELSFNELIFIEDIILEEVSYDI